VGPDAPHQLVGVLNQLLGDGRIVRGRGARVRGGHAGSVANPPNEPTQNNSGKA
jgi:hypothetical protein